MRTPLWTLTGHILTLRRTSFAYWRNRTENVYLKKKKNTAPPPVESGKGLSPVILNKGSKAKARADEGCPVEGRWRTPAVGRMRKY